MSSRYFEDVSQTSLNKSTGIEGVESIIRAYNDGTAEVKNILKNEVDVIFECRFCRSFFRGIPNLVTHKRLHCRGLHQTVVANAAACRKMAQEQEAAEKEREKDNKKNPSSFRRLNIVGVLNKRATDIEVPVPNCKKSMTLSTLPRVCKDVPVTIFEDGRQKIIDVPIQLAQKEAVPEDRVVLVMPQDYSTKYREMQLRNRRDNASKQDCTRDMTTLEIEMLDRCNMDLNNNADVINLRCLHLYCTSVKPFGSVAALVYHICIKHSRNSGDNANLCFTCGKEFKTFTNLQRHMKLAHKDVIEEHENFRARDIDNDKKKSSKKVIKRVRSMSPVRDGDLPMMEDDAIKKEDDDNSMPPIIRAIGESDMDERTADDDDPPQLVRMPTISVSRRRMKISTPLASATKSDGDQSNSSSGVSSPNRARDLSIEQDNTRSNVSVESSSSRMEMAWAERRERKKMEMDILRSVEYMITKVEEGVTDVKVGDLSSREPSVSSGRQTPYDQGVDGTLKPASFDRRSLNGTSTARVARKAKIAARRSQIMPKQRSKLAKVDGPGEESDSSDTLESIRTKTITPSPELRTSPDDQLTRPTRNRKRPDWMDDAEYIMDKGQKKNREGLSSSPTPTYLEYDDVPPSIPSNSKVSRELSKLGIDMNTSVIRTKPAVTSATDVRAVSDNSSANIVHTKKPGTWKDPPQLTAHHDTAPAKKPHQKPGGIQSKKTTSQPVAVVDSKPSVSETQAEVKKEASTPTSSPVKKTTIPHSSAAPSMPNHQYTPRANRMIRGLPAEPILDAAAVTADAPGLGSSRRKQNMNEQRDVGDEATLVSTNGRLEQPTGDLAHVPVFLSQMEKEIFFRGLKSKNHSDSGAHAMAQEANPDMDNPYVCSYCQTEVPNLRDGRRHMVSHIRVMRLRCKLCKAGAFFCSDMRDHLTERWCPMLSSAPAGIVRDGVPCMQKHEADMLTEIVDKHHPGRVMYTSGQIISATCKQPYYPDPVIEERILGGARVQGRSSPMKQRPRPDVARPSAPRPDPTHPQPPRPFDGPGF